MLALQILIDRFGCLCCSSVPVFLGLFFAPFYIQLNAVTHGVDEQLAFYAVSGIFY